MPFNKPCLDCGRLTKAGRCPECKRAHDEKKGGAYLERKARKAHLYGGDYTQRAKHVRATATICHLCGEGAKPGKAWAWEADHLYPELGKNSPLAAAHGVCNRKRGNTPLPDTRQRGAGHFRGGENP
jgi:hypothetical protein